MRDRGTESIAGARSISGSPVSGTKRQPTESQRTVAEIDKFWRDRAGRAIVTRITEYNGHVLVDIRTFFTANDGTLRPAKGLACGVRLLPQLGKAIQKAIFKARELGLIDESADG
jgi:hypothetical protein